MVIPKRRDTMIRNAMNRNRRNIKTKCEKKFPDCPKEKNKEFCRMCPFWK